LRTPSFIQLKRTYILNWGFSIINYSHLEDFINQLYINLHVNNPNQLEIAYLSKRLNLNIYYGKVSLRYEDDLMIKKSNKQKEWQLFGHEVGHYLRHTGNHLAMHSLFMDMQEYQATNFAYHFCIPTFMLHEISEFSVYNVMNLFNVEYGFASRRLEMYQSKFMGVAENAGAYH